MTYAYRVYMTDCFYLRAQDKMFSERWVDLVDPNYTAQEEKNGDEIAAEVMAAAGLKFGGE